MAKTYDIYDPEYWTSEATRAYTTGISPTVSTYKPATTTPTTYATKTTTPQYMVYDPNEYAAVDPYLGAYARRQAQAELVTSALQAPPTQYYKGVPSYQEQLNRVQALSEQYPWLKTYMETGVSAPVTGTYQPRIETQLKTTLKDYISKAGQGFQDIGRAFAEPFGTQPAYAAEGIPTKPEITPSMEGKERKGTVTVLPEKEFWEGVEATVGRGKYSTAQAMFEKPELIFKQPMTKFTGSQLPTYWDVAWSSNQIGAASTRIAEGVQMGVADLPSVGNLIETKTNDNQISVLVSSFKKLIDAGSLPTGALPPISDERLNNIGDHDVMRNVWDTGYKASTVTNFATQTLTDFYNQTGIPLYGVESDEQLQQIDYTSLMNVLHDISGQGKYSVSDFARMKEEGKTLRLNTSFKSLDGFGNPIFSAYFETDVPFEPKKKTEKQTEAEYWAEWQKDVDHYWDARQVADRNARREESWQWSRNKDLEGWTEYYASLDALKLAPFMNEWASSTAMFNELRRIWETTAKGQSWTDFLKGYDFWSKWYAQRPSERGERPTAFAPILQGVSRL